MTATADSQAPVQQEREFTGMIPDQFFRVRAANSVEAEQKIIAEMRRRLDSEDIVLITN